MIQKGKINIVDTYGILFTIVALLVFVCMLVFGCTSKEEFPEAIKNDDSSSSLAEEDEFEPWDVSSSSEFNDSVPSHSPELPIGYGCNYNQIWCNGMAFDKIKTKSMTGDIGDLAKYGEERPNCVFAKEIKKMGNESSPMKVNGKELGRCGRDATSSGWNGDAWGQKPCSELLAGEQKVDGGYYIYIPLWAGDFFTTGGEPNCSGTGNPGIGNSSSSAAATAPSGDCVEPMYGVPPNGAKSCIKVSGKCYTCNSDRGDDCLQAWVWQGGNVSDQYWYKEVSCSEASGSGGSTPTYNLTCTGLAQTGVAGTAIAQPTVKCNGDNVTATFASAPNWNSPVAGTFNVSATANCGGNKTVSCGTIVVSTAPTTSTLTCTGLAATGIAGTAITQPTVKCGTANVSNPTFTGAPNWNNPAANTYTISATGTGSCSGQTAACGTIKVNPKLTCGNPSPQTVIAGTAVTAPTVQCGNTTVASNGISWSGAPTYWSSPDVGTYNNIKATANTGDCNGQTATCGTLTVNPKLTCGSVAQTITTGSTPVKPSVSCGTATVTSGITWNPSSINNAINTAQTINNVTATANSGNCNGQTATCSGTITVIAPAASSSSGGGTPNTGTPVTNGKNGSGWASRYWDGCKPSCGWSGNMPNGGTPTKSCDNNGTTQLSNDARNYCMDGGNAHTCYSQAPWAITDNVAYAFAASHTNGDCGKCFRLTFKGTTQHAANSNALNHIKNKIMVVKVSNIGGDVQGTQFDLMIPGGGLGAFDGFTMQSGVNGGVLTSSERYGGFVSDCGGGNNGGGALSTLQQCVKDKCDAAFTNADLKAGCKFYADWAGAANNPQFDFIEVTCPSELNSKW